MGALLAGVYDGETTVPRLLTHEDFGLGTFNHLNGEMVILDGICYHLHSDGQASIAHGSEQTLFAAVTRFTLRTSEPLRAAGHAAKRLRVPSGHVSPG